jgi:hypothetical protein
MLRARRRAVAGPGSWRAGYARLSSGEPDATEIFAGRPIRKRLGSEAAVTHFTPPGAADGPATERIVMPSHDAQPEPDEHISRRSLLHGAAAAGAAGLAVTALGAGVSQAASAATRSAAQPETAAGREVTGPIVVHVRDARSGDIEVLSGTSQTTLRDKDLAARIARTVR